MADKKIGKAVILAAGNGSHLLPITNFIPKTMMLYKDKPLMYYHINNLLYAGIKDIIVVTRKDEDNNYAFKIQNDYIKTLEKELNNYDKDIKINLIYQENDEKIKKPKGPAAAVAAAADMLTNSNYIVVMGDNLVVDKKSGESFIPYLLSKFDGNVVVSTELVDEKKAQSCGVIKTRKLEDILEIYEAKEKPSKECLIDKFGEKERYDAMGGGLYILNSRSTGYMKNVLDGTNQEKHITDAINDQIIKEGKTAHGIEIDKTKYESLDFGRINNWLEINLRPENISAFTLGIKNYDTNLRDIVNQEILKFKGSKRV
jgi:UTP-glucose-1-phosphate uridylyltransferase